MAPSVLALVLLLAASSAREQSRWSRQISSYTADISDWVPLSAPVEQPTVEVKRQAVAEPRILAEPFPAYTRNFNQDFRNQQFYQNRPLYLQSVPSVPSAPQNFLNDQGFGQSIRFGLSQPNFPLNQGFVSPQFNFDTVPQIKPRPTVPSNPIKFESFPKQLPSPQAKPFINQNPLPAPKKPLQQAPKFVDGYRLENASNDFIFHQKKKPQSLQKLKFEVPKTETVVPNKSKLEREEVQLLYVPVESLNQGQFNFRNPQIQYSSNIPKQNPIKQPFIGDFQRPAKPAEHINFGQDYFNYNPKVNEFDQIPKFSTIPTPFPTAPPTTPRPKKLKPHQPPLAVFLSQEAKKGDQVKVGDVLSSLKNANTIAVLDAVNPLNAPKVFIGPSTLTPPENYVKFELPYLSNIENSDNKLRQLPFFVAPLSYHTPDGFAKIPFPSPHVGSVVINSQIKDSAPATTPFADVIPNSYVASPPSQKHEQSQVTQKPNFSYYSTVAPKTNAPAHQSEYYSFEPQTVTSIRPSKEPSDGINSAPQKPGSYFLNEAGQQYNPNQYVEYSQENYGQEQIKSNIAKQPEPTIPTTTRTPKTTAKPSSTYSSQLLETHNPYSINQAFHFSTPLDYNNFFDERDNYSTQQFKPLPSSSASPTPSTTPQHTTTTLKPEIVTEKQLYQQTPTNYAQQNYSPEIHYESEIQSSRFPVYNSNEFTTKTEYSHPETVQTNNVAAVNNHPADIDSRYVESQTPAHDNFASINEIPTTAAGASPQPTNPSYNQYDTGFVSNESQESSTTTTTTTTTTRRSPIRSRGRPRYSSTTPRTDSNESSTKFTATRRPLRERRPLATRPRYEPNKITSEKPTRKPVDSNESSTKSSAYSSRSRPRGRVQFKPSESDEGQYNRNKASTKEEDLAYQRDVLHQNYPVTLMERTSTVDIEAITEPTSKFQSTKNVESPATYDTENAYTYERASVSQPNVNSASHEHTFPSRNEGRTETPYVPYVPSTRNEEYVYHSRSSSAPVDAASYDESPENEDIYAKQTTPIQKDASAEVSYATEAVSPVTEQAPNYSVTIRQETTTPEKEEAKFLSEEANHEEEEVQTTPSYNRVRVRPGLIRQYHQASTEASKTKDRKRPVQAITYRPAFDRRRTTMRIEEIGEDLKTKQVFARPDVQEHRHPVYKPEPTTEAPATTAAQETSTKRGQFRRRRPSYTTTSTEGSYTKKNTYEVKNRFRGRRPTTEKPTEKSEVQTETSSTTVRNNLHSRYSNRPRLSERYNKKPETEEQDQEPNYSINRPKFAEPDADQWAADSFKPYNPNDIIDDRKDATAGLQTDDEGELDIITAKNEYDDILISVTPASNRLNKKIPDIPPTLEALVEQSKVTNSDSPDTMSTFESMLEEVMKSLEEQDEDEYTSNVMKHKGGEIGEIPPERIISSGDNYKPSTQNEETTTIEPNVESSTLSEEDKERRGRRRGFWKVRVRPATTETIEAAESQHFAAAVNHLGAPVGKAAHDKHDLSDKPAKVTTYKPTFNIKDILTEDSSDEFPAVDISKLKDNKPEEPQPTTENILQKETPTEMSPGDLDLGTGSPDPTVAEYTTTEATSAASIDRNDGFSFMDYIFGTTGDSESDDKKSATTKAIEITTEPKIRITTTESSVIPEEITAVPENDENIEVTEYMEIKKANATELVTEAQAEGTEKPVQLETSSVSSFMDPAAVLSTSMSTEVSHETEICFRGKCIKTSKDLL